MSGTLITADESGRLAETRPARRPWQQLTRYKDIEHNSSNCSSMYTHVNNKTTSNIPENRSNISSLRNTLLVRISERVNPQLKSGFAAIVLLIVACIPKHNNIIYRGDPAASTGCRGAQFPPRSFIGAGARQTCTGALRRARAASTIAGSSILACPWRDSAASRCTPGTKTPPHSRPPLGTLVYLYHLAVVEHGLHCTALLVS